VALLLGGERLGYGGGGDGRLGISDLAAAPILTPPSGAGFLSGTSSSVLPIAGPAKDLDPISDPVSVILEACFCNPASRRGFFLINISFMQYLLLN